MSTAEIKTTQIVTDEPEKLDLRSFDIPDEKRAELLALFPEVRTEGGKIDFDRLRLAVGETVDVGKERYGMNWPGKADCFRTIQTPSVGTLLPASKESVNFDTTENLIIEGDNLEILKLLQKSYLGKIKMIYIDPPYNTGKDFIYPDNYAESLETYLEYTGQVDAEGKKFGTNTEADGRFHSKWLNMMYPRLFLAKNLLAPTGAVFISIDDAELLNLTRAMDEIFGEEHRLGIVTVVSNLKGRSDDKYLATAHNYLLAYSVGEFQSRGVQLPDEYWDEYPEISSDGRQYRLQGLRKRGSGARRVDRPNMYYSFFVNPQTKQVSLRNSDSFNVEVLPKLSDGEDGRWRWGKDTAQSRLDELTAETVGPDKRWDVFQIDYAEGESGAKRIKPKTVWIGPEFSNEAGSLEVKRIIGKSVFDTCKPVGLINYCLEQAMDNDGIVMDFFAGSGTTAQAVLEANASDGGKRQFILIQLPELLDPLEKEQKAGADFCDSIGKPRNIAEIMTERVRLISKSLRKEAASQLNLNGQQGQDFGFRKFYLAESNFTTWDAGASKDGTALAAQLDLHIDHIRQQRTDDDILYELLLKSGFPLTTPVEKKTVEGKTVYAVAGGALVICLDRALTLDLIRAIADMKPERVVCLDEGFAGTTSSRPTPFRPSRRRASLASRRSDFPRHEAPIRPKPDLPARRNRGDCRPIRRSAARRAGILRYPNGGYGRLARRPATD